MTYLQMALDRVTPKFRDKTNYKRIINYVAGLFDPKTSYIEIIKKAKSISDSETYLLDELGKLLGAYPRPFVPISATESDFFVYDLNGYDQYPYASESQSVRRLNDAEYRLLLRGYAILANVKGTVGDWENIISAVAGDVPVRVINRPSEFDVVIQADLTDSEKRLIEALLDKVNNLTVSIRFLGTTSGETPFTYGITPYSTAAYIEGW